MDIKKLKELRDKGIVSESGFTRAKIITRYESMDKTMRKADLYYKIGDEFCLSEGRVKNIITSYYRKAKGC